MFIHNDFEVDWQCMVFCLTEAGLVVSNGDALISEYKQLADKNKSIWNNYLLPIQLNEFGEERHGKCALALCEFLWLKIVKHFTQQERAEKELQTPWHICEIICYKNFVQDFAQIFLIHKSVVPETYVRQFFNDFVSYLLQEPFRSHIDLPQICQIMQISWKFPLIQCSTAFPRLCRTLLWAHFSQLRDQMTWFQSLEQRLIYLSTLSCFLPEMDHSIWQETAKASVSIPGLQLPLGKETTLHAFSLLSKKIRNELMTHEKMDATVFSDTQWQLLLSALEDTVQQGWMEIFKFDLDQVSSVGPECILARGARILGVKLKSCEQKQQFKNLAKFMTVLVKYLNRHCRHLVSTHAGAVETGLSAADHLNYLQYACEQKLCLPDIAHFILTSQLSSQAEQERLLQMLLTIIQYSVSTEVPSSIHFLHHENGVLLSKLVDRMTLAHRPLQSAQTVLKTFLRHLAPAEKRQLFTWAHKHKPHFMEKASYNASLRALANKLTAADNRQTDQPQHRHVNAKVIQDIELLLLQDMDTTLRHVCDVALQQGAICDSIIDFLDCFVNVLPTTLHRGCSRALLVHIVTDQLFSSKYQFEYNSLETEPLLVQISQCYTQNGENLAWKAAGSLVKGLLQSMHKHELVDQVNSLLLCLMEHLTSSSPFFPLVLIFLEGWIDKAANGGITNWWLDALLPDHLVLLLCQIGSLMTLFDNSEVYDCLKVILLHLLSNASIRQTLQPNREFVLQYFYKRCNLQTRLAFHSFYQLSETNLVLPQHFAALPRQIVEDLTEGNIIIETPEFKTAQVSLHPLLLMLVAADSLSDVVRSSLKAHQSDLRHVISATDLWYTFVQILPRSTPQTWSQCLDLISELIEMDVIHVQSDLAPLASSFVVVKLIMDLTNKAIDVFSRLHLTSHSVVYARVIATLQKYVPMVIEIAKQEPDNSLLPRLCMEVIQKTLKWVPENYEFSLNVLLQHVSIMCQTT